MRKLNNVMEFGRLVTELEDLTKDQRRSGQKELGMAKANHIVKTACKIYKDKGRKGVVDGDLLIKSINTQRAGRLWITSGQADRGVAIVQVLINKTRWGIFSRMTRNMRKICG